MTRISIEQAMQMAMQHHREGRLPAAETVYRQILAVQPNQSDALQLLGLVLSNYKRFDEAIDHIRRAIAIQPGVMEYHYNLAQVLENAGRLADAVPAYERAIELKPETYEAHHNLGTVLTKLRRNEQAAAVFRRCVVMRPELSESHRLLGSALLETGQVDEGVAEARKAVSLQPNSIEALNALGVGLVAAGKIDEGIDSYQRAVSLRPDYSAAHYNLAMALLLVGKLEAGWAHYEHRWHVGDPLPKFPDFPQPLWDGSPLNGRRIYLWPEQGFGDMIQYVRYVPQVAQRGGRVILAAPAELETLMQTLEGVEQVVTTRRPDPSIDLHLPIMSLPRIFETGLKSIPTNIPYLHADARKSATWRDRLANIDGHRKIGLAWAGRPTHANDRNRSMTLPLFKPLAGVANTHLISLQKGPASEQMKSVPPDLKISDFASDLHDFSDTAALIQNLDLIITVDTAIAHLAGALGKPVWVLLPYRPDWRWMLDREDSPWYPTMRLFRQPAAGDWQNAIERITRLLDEQAGP